MPHPPLDIPAIQVLRVVAGSDEPLNGSEVHEKLLARGERARRRGLFAAASLGGTYGMLQAFSGHGLLSVSCRMVRGKEVDCYEITTKGRRVLREAAIALTESVVEIQRSLGVSTA